jgi:tight adherence protein B
MTQTTILRLALVVGVVVCALIGGILVLLRSQRNKQVYQQRILAVIDRPGQAVQAQQAALALAQEKVRSGAFTWLVRVLTRSARRRPNELILLLILVVVGLIFSGLLTNFLLDLIGTFALPVLGLGPLLLCRFVFGWRDERLEDAYRQQFPEALAVIARTVRTGVPVVEALRIVARESEDPTAAEFTYIVNRITIGIPLGEALHSSAERTGLLEHRLFATAVSLQSQSGGGLTETLIGLSATIRRRITARARARAMASEATTTSYILGGLPVVTASLLGVANPTYIAVLFTDHTGNIILTVACTMLLTGMFIMHTIIKRSLT